ncbi:MAG TPA: DoxX family protein [Vicinamibacterales bacterium]|nr:DoxX family protein [Vicinamibacterales bacterium]
MERVGLLVLRLGFAALLLGFHGWTRLGRAIGYVFYGQPWTFVDLVGRLGFPIPAVFAVLSAAAESIGAVLVAVGLFTRWASAVIAINMAVALTNEALKGDPLELPALYLLGAVTILLLGPGLWSLDGVRGRRRRT